MLDCPFAAVSSLNSGHLLIVMTPQICCVMKGRRVCAITTLTLIFFSGYIFASIAIKKKDYSLLLKQMHINASNSTLHGDKITLNQLLCKGTNVTQHGNGGKSYTHNNHRHNNTSRIQHTPLKQTGCLNDMCLNFITPEEKKTYESCIVKTTELHQSIENGTCHFIDGTFGRSPVALTSVQGSGNTWVRGLLELATGVCTGIIIIL